MKIHFAHLTVLFPLLLSYSCVTTAEIYKWYDENGKLHFGDRLPEDMSKKEAEVIEVKPAGGTNPEQPPQATKSRSYSYTPPVKPKKSQPREPQKESHQDQLKKFCAEAQAEYSKYSTFNHKDGGYEVWVLKDDNGKMLSRREQDELAEKYRAKVNRKGCKIQRSPGLRTP